MQESKILRKNPDMVMEMIDGKRTLAEIKTKLLKEFDATPKEVDKEMASLLKNLKEIKAVV